MHLLLWILGFALVVVLLGALYQALGTRRDARRFPPPGQLLNVGGRKQHIWIEGTGPATVILEAGLMSTVLSWSGLREQLVKSYRVVAYDRAGLGWSDLGPMPRSADRLAAELRELLRTAGIEPPYILVGHSFGGLTVPAYAAAYPADTLGMVLVDPVAPAEWLPPSDRDAKNARIGAKVCRRAALLSKFGIIRFVAFLLTAGAKGLGALLVRGISRGTPAQAGTVSSPWFWALPPQERAMAAIFWIQEKFALTIASQLDNLPASAASAANLGASYDKPVTILSAANSPQRRLDEHAAIARRLPRGEHILAARSNHWIMQDQPELVLDAVRRVAASRLTASR